MGSLPESSFTSRPDGILFSEGQANLRLELTIVSTMKCVSFSMFALTAVLLLSRPLPSSCQPMTVNPADPSSITCEADAVCGCDNNDRCARNTVTTAGTCASKKCAFCIRKLPGNEGLFCWDGTRTGSPPMCPEAGSDRVVPCSQLTCE